MNRSARRLRSLALSPDGRTLVAGCDDGWAQLWELPSRRPLARFRAHRVAISEVEFRSDGRAFLTASAWGPQVQVWDPMSQKPILGAPIRHPEAGVNQARFRPDGKVIVTMGNSTVRLWETSSGRPLSGPWDQGHQNKAEFSPDSRLLFGFGLSSMLRVWSCATGKPQGTPIDLGHKVEAVAFLDGGRRFATVTATSLARGGRYADENRVSIFDTATLRPIATAPPITSGLSCVGSRPGGRVVAAGTHGGRVQLFDAQTARPLGEPLIHDDGILGLAFSPDGQFLLTSTQDGTVRLFDGDSGRALDSVAGNSTQQVIGRLSPDGRTLMTAGDDRTVRIWDIAGVSSPGRPLLLATAVQTAQFSPDGRHVATAGFDGTARLFEVATGLPHGPPLEHPPKNRVARFSPDGRLLATGGDDNLVRLWDVATGRRIGKPLPHPDWVVNARFSPDGRTLLVGCVEGKARLWDTESGQPLGPALEHPARVMGVAISPDARTLLTIAFNGMLQFWDAATGKPIGPAAKHDGFVPVGRLDDRLPVAFHTSGRLAFSAGNTTYLWNVPTLATDSERPPGGFARQLAGREFDNQNDRRPLERGEWDELRRLAASRDAGDVPIADDAWHDTLALQMQAEGSTEAALWHLDRMIASHPRDWSLHARRLAVHAQRGDLDQAARDDAKARALGPRPAVDAWHWHQAFNLIARGRWRAALVFLDDSLPAFPDQPYPLFLRALALTHPGRPDEAVAALGQAVNHGFHDIDRLKTTGDLGPLRDRDDFQRLVASLQNK